MAVAENIHRTGAVDLESCLRASLGVELDDLRTVIPQHREEGDTVLPAHGVVQHKIVFILHDLDPGQVLALRGLGLQRRKRYPAAAYHCLAGAEQNVAAHRTDMEFAAIHVEAAVAVHHIRAAEKLRHRRAERPGQRLDQRDIRITLARFP